MRYLVLTTSERERVSCGGRGDRYTAFTASTFRYILEKKKRTKLNLFMIVSSLSKHSVFAVITPNKWVKNWFFC